MSAKTASILTRLKGDDVLAEEKDGIKKVYVQLDPIALRDNIALLLQVHLRQRTRGGTKFASLLTDDLTGVCVALSNSIVKTMATCLHARELSKKCDDGCCAAMMALPRLLAELCLSVGPVEATTLGGLRCRFTPVLNLNGGDCGIPSGWDRDREEAGMDALKNGKPTLPLVDVSADIACSTTTSSWWLMQRHDQDIYSPVQPLSALKPLDYIGAILMANPFSDNVALFVDGPGQVARGLRAKVMEAAAVPATCPDLFAACAGEVVSVKIAQRAFVDRNADGSIVVLPAAPTPERPWKSQSGAPPPPPPPPPAAGSRDATSPLFLPTPALTFSPAAASVACGEPPEPSGASSCSAAPSARPSVAGAGGFPPPRASVSLAGAGPRASSSSRAGRPSMTGSAAGGSGGGVAASAVVLPPRGDFGAVVTRAPGGQTAGEAGVTLPPGTPLSEQMWVVFVRHYLYRARLTKEGSATKELAWETFIQGCF